MCLPIDLATANTPAHGTLVEDLSVLPSAKTLELYAERGTQYGDAAWGLRNFTKALQALLEQHLGTSLPGELRPDFGAQVHVLIKMMRSVVKAPFKRDTYDDESTYTDIAFIVRRTYDKSIPRTDVEDLIEDEI